MSLTITVDSFFSRVRSFFCSVVQQHQLELRPKHTRNARTSSKTKTSTSRPEPRKNSKDPSPFGVFHSDFFGTMRIFLKFHGLHQRVPLRLFRYVAKQSCQKIPKGPLFTFFGTDTVQKSHFQNFSEIFKISQGSPFNFFHILQITGVSQSSKGLPFYNFEP